MPGVRLRPFRESDLGLLERFATDPDFSEPFEWSGFSPPQRVRRRWEKDGLLGKDRSLLVIGLPDGKAAGWVMWRDPELFGRKGWVWEIGIILAPEHRGRGLGRESQAQLARHLFDTTTVHRLHAYTEADNVAEQRALDACGFRREGVLVRAGFRAGAWRDVMLYALLRDDRPAG